jgi:hypothetical protein
MFICVTLKHNNRFLTDNDLGPFSTIIGDFELLYDPIVKWPNQSGDCWGTRIATKGYIHNGYQVSVFCDGRSNIIGAGSLGMDEKLLDLSI